MTSKPPVPSKAALHALRGLVFTTSCSVAVLAEERRRRTKIARTAIDNARKLHTLKARRQAMPMLAERLPHPDPENLSHHSSSDTPRPRRRRKPPAEIGREDGDGSHEVHRTVDADEGNPLRRPSKTMDGSIGSLHVAKDSQRPADFRTRPSIMPLTNIYTHLPPNPENREGESHAQRQAFVGYDDWRAVMRQKFQDNIFTDFDRIVLVAEKVGVSEDLMCAIKDRNTHRHNHHVWNALKYLTWKPRFSKDALVLDEAAYVINGLLRDLTPRETVEVNDAEGTELSLRLVLSVLEKIGSFEAPLTESETALHIKKQCTTVLMVASKRRSPEMARALSVVLSLHHDASTIITVLVSRLAAIRDEEATQHCVRAFADPNVSTHLTGFTIMSMLGRHWKKQKTAWKTREIYELLNKGGVLDMNESIRRKKRTIEEFMSQIEAEALEQSIEGLASLELAMQPPQREHVPNNSRSKKSNVLLQGEALIRDINHGRSGSIAEDLERVKGLRALSQQKSAAAVVWGQSQGDKADDFQIIVHQLANHYISKYSTSVFEGVIRSLTKDYAVDLEFRWVISVLRYHSRRVDIDAMVSWLRFCFRSGVSADNAFSQKLFWVLAKFWNFPDREIIELYHCLLPYVDDLRWPFWCLETPSEKETSGIKLDRNYRQYNTTYIHHANRLLRPIDQSDVQCFGQMYLDAQDHKWEEVWETFDRAAQAGMSFSERCLRIAVYARLRIDNGSTKNASDLVWKYHTEGHDVTEAIAPLFLDYLDEGFPPERVVFKAINEGFKLDDIVFNRAAQMEAYSQRHRSALRITEAAIGLKCSGDPLANQYYFVNLLGSYVATTAYGRLSSLIDRFTSEKFWWAGKQAVMNRLKWAVKTLGRRIHNCRSGGQPESSHMLMLEKIDEAVEHSYDCRLQVDRREEVGNELIDAYVDAFEFNNPDAHTGRDETGVDMSEAGMGEFSTLEETLEEQLKLEFPDNSPTRQEKSEATQAQWNEFIGKPQSADGPSQRISKPAVDWEANDTKAPPMRTKPSKKKLTEVFDETDPIAMKMRMGAKADDLGVKARTSKSSKQSMTTGQAGFDDMDPITRMMKAGAKQDVY